MFSSSEISGVMVEMQIWILFLLRCNMTIQSQNMNVAAMGSSSRTARISHSEDLELCICCIAHIFMPWVRETRVQLEAGYPPWATPSFIGQILFLLTVIVIQLQIYGYGCAICHLRRDFLYILPVERCLYSNISTMEECYMLKTIHAQLTSSLSEMLSGHRPEGWKEE